MPVPEYYKTSDGRMFADYFNCDIAEILSDDCPTIPNSVYHAIVSAAEHRYRRGFKPGMEQHDIEAESFWLNQAQSEADRQGMDADSFCWIVATVKAMVDYDLSLKHAGGVS